MPEWFRIDPFFIFGLLMQIALIGYGLFLLRKALKWRRFRKRIKDMDALAWARAINDPDAPTRPNAEYVRKHRRNRE